MVARHCPIVTNWAAHRNCTRRSRPDGRQIVAAESRAESNSTPRYSDLLRSGGASPDHPVSAAGVRVTRMSGSETPTERRYFVTSGLCVPVYVARILIDAKSHKTRMPQMIIRCPFRKLKLPDQL